MAKVTKILETTLAAGATSVTFNDADIPNSLIRVYATNSNIYPQNISLTGNVLTVTYEEQTSSMGVALELVKQGLDINDTLTSTAADEALSAAKGKVLKDMIDALPAPPDEITDLSDVVVTDIEDGQVLAWDEVSEKFVNVDQSGGSSVSWGTPVHVQDSNLKTVNSEYAIDFNGFVTLYVAPSSSTVEVYLTVVKKNTDFRYGVCWSRSGYYSSICIPVADGDVLVTTQVSNVSRVELNEYPFA